jgi:hypothetical protein
MRENNPFDFLFRLTLTFLQTSLNTLIKIFVKLFYFMFRFIRRKIKKTIHFLNQSLTRDELFSLTLFVIFFVFTDRRSNKKIKYDKTKAPNILWRIVALYMYLPLWYEFVYPCFMFFAERTPPLDMTFNYEFSIAINKFFYFTREMERFFNGRFNFIGLYNVFLYFSTRFIVRFLPEKIFHLPMFMRYHMVLCSLFSILFPLLEQPYILISGIMPDNSRQFLQLTTKDETFAMNMAMGMVILYIFSLGNYTWQAARGKSFTNIKGFFDIVIRTHLGFESLYKNEKWSDYGMDDLSDYNDNPENN